MAASLIHQLPSLDSLRPSIFGRSHSYEEQHRALPSPLEVSRPPSTASTQSSYFHTPPPPAAQHTRQRHSSMVNLPALSSLTPLISASGGRPPQSVFGPASTYPPQYGMATVAPGQSNSQGADEPPACQNCSTFKTPLWRRDDNGSVLCNACGLFLKLHGRPRPISLKTDVIKSRNRVKIPQQAGQKRKAGPSLAAAYPDVASGGPRRAQQDSALLDNSQTQGPLSGSSTPNAYTPAQPAHPSNIAPQHMFDSASLSNNDAHALAFNVNSPSFNAHGGRQESPSTALLNGASHDALIAENNSLKTRVSELEVINELFRGRVAELERELEARRAIETGEARQAVEAAMRGNAAAEANNNFNAEARQRSDAGLGDIDESNNDNTNEGNTGPATTASVTRSSKRVRMSDLVDDHDEEAASPTAEE